MHGGFGEQGGIETASIASLLIVVSIIALHCLDMAMSQTVHESLSNAAVN